MFSMDRPVKVAGQPVSFRVVPPSRGRAGHTVPSHQIFCRVSPGGDGGTDGAGPDIKVAFDRKTVRQQKQACQKTFVSVSGVRIFICDRSAITPMKIRHHA
jgi:hypothetical protein